MSFQCPHCSTVAKSEAGLQKHISSAHSERAEDEILIDGRKRVKTIQDEFTKLYPFLGLNFFTEEEIQKSKEGGSIKSLDGDQSLSKVRTTKGSTNTDFKVTSRMHVGTMETSFSKEFGLQVQVCVQKEGKSFYTSGEMDKLSLKDLNVWCETNGYSKWSYANWRK